MTRRWVAVAGLVLALAGSGCGVAGETDVTRDHPGPERGFFRQSEGVKPPDRRSSSDPIQFVKNFLRAASGEPKDAVVRLKEFMDPDTAADWRPTPEIVVVRDAVRLASSERDNVLKVTVSFKPVGLFTDKGAVEPVDWPDAEHTFEVVRDKNGLFLRKSYGQILLSASALEAGSTSENPADEPLYQPHLLYFWSNEERGLVPDLRYLPRSVQTQNVPSEMVRRLLLGPSDWLKPAVKALPEGTEMRGNVLLENGRLVVDLNVRAISAKNLLAQLRWTLWEVHPGPITLLIEGQEKASSGSRNEEILANPAATLPEAEMFCVADGKVFAGCRNPWAEQNLAVLAAPGNRDVESAAFLRRAESTHLALVVMRPDGKRELRIVRTERGGEKAKEATAAPLFTTTSRPVWLNNTFGERGAAGMIAADGSLYTFGNTGTMVRLTTSVSKISAVAAAPDGRRIAFLAGGRLYVAALFLQGDSFTLGQPQLLATSTSTGGLVGVAWSRPERVVVAGANRIIELTVDGAIESTVIGPPDNPDNVVWLVAHTLNLNPGNGSTRGPMLAMTPDRLPRQVYYKILAEIRLDPRPSAPPAPGKEGPAPKAPVVTAPFWGD
jgi:hypothetical protein